MHILQAGYKKSGNSWLYTILRAIIENGNIPYQSVMANDPIFPIAKTWEHSFARQAEVDMLNFSRNRPVYQFPRIYEMPILDIDAYIASNTLVWTHHEWSKIAAPIFPKFTKIIYIIRDPRDCLISLYHFDSAPHRQKFKPNAVVRSSEEFMQENLLPHLEVWSKHVLSFLNQLDKHDIHIVFYEQLLVNFETELVKMLDYLGIELDAETRLKIAKQVSFDTMQVSSPNHVRQGKAYKWMEQLPAALQAQCLREVGDIVRLMNYPEQPSEMPSLPTLDRLNTESIMALNPVRKAPLRQRLVMRLQRMLS